MPLRLGLIFLLGLLKFPEAGVFDGGCGKSYLERNNNMINTEHCKSLSELAVVPDGLMSPLAIFLSQSTKERRAVTTCDMPRELGIVMGSNKDRAANYPSFDSRQTKIKEQTARGRKTPCQQDAGR